MIKKSEFYKSSSALAHCPKPNKPEFAFIGRSNVGKSSLINMICSKKNLAKTSSTPGKTRLINHFLMDEEWFLTDLPGYGYAKVGKSQKSDFEQLITDYCTKRENLISLFILIDSRLELQAIDREFMAWCGENQISFVLVFTKTDKLTRNLLNKNIHKIKQSILQDWEECPLMFLTSSEKGVGREEILGYIEQNKKYFGNKK